MTSRERLLTAIAGEKLDYVPCAFMIFSAMRERMGSDIASALEQLNWGLDPVLDIATWYEATTSDHPDLPGPPLAIHPETRITEWVEDSPEEPIIHRRYDTPSGPLTSAVRWTKDWHADAHVPLFDDWIVPRAAKFLVETEEDLDRLPYVLAPPDAASIALLRERAEPKKRVARERGILLAAGMGVGLEAVAWLSGFEQMALAGIQRPDWLQRLVEILHEWNLARMKALLDVSLDIFFRRGWYEGTDFLSPGMFQRYVLPFLKREVEVAHEAGAVFAYINTSGTMPILPMIMEAGVDVLVGIDPVQGKGTDMVALREQSRGKMALWGGVNGFVTVETRSPEEVRREVDYAMRTLGPEGFILSPVDNVVDTSEKTWENVKVLIEEWRKLRCG